jgi:hypothetical protein
MPVSDFYDKKKNIEMGHMLSERLKQAESAGESWTKIAPGTVQELKSRCLNSIMLTGHRQEKRPAQRRRST